MTRRPLSLQIASLALTLLMVLVTTSPLMTPVLDEQSVVLPTEGRQDALDVDCSGYSFEDLFTI